MRVNKWRATRRGVDADIIADDQGSRVLLADAIRDLVEELSPVASALGCLDELTFNLEVLERGPSYLRQRRVMDGGGSPRDIVDALIREMETDRPTWP